MARVQHESGPIALWWEALMFYVPLNLLGIALLPLTTFQRRFQVGYFLVFVVANYVIFQPWELDNTKVGTRLSRSSILLHWAPGRYYRKLDEAL